MVARGRVAVVAVALAALAASASCRTPTAVEVRAETNVAYRSGLVVSFTVGTPNDTETSDPTTEANGPWGSDGFVGSLVVVPRGAEDARLGVKIVLGVRRDARECRPPGYEGCIVARRSLTFLPHTRLQLPVALFADCENVPCDAFSTCARGACVSAEVDQVTCTSNQVCALPGAPELVPGTPPVSSDGSFDAASGNDASSSNDAALDGPADAPADSGDVDAGGGGIDCGQGTTCAPGQFCCWSDTSLIGACIAPGGACPYRVIRCDRRSQCKVLCCADPSGTTCGPLGCGGRPEICHGNTVGLRCYDGTQQCTGLTYGLYDSCQ